MGNAAQGRATEVFVVSMRVVVPLDGSPLSEAVLPRLCEFIGDREATVCLVRVITPYPNLLSGMYPQDPSAEDDVEAEMTAEATAYLDDVAQRIPDDHILVRRVVRAGAPARAIVELAREWGADLIAMSTHGHAGLARILLGSVAAQVVRTAGIPVLLVRPEAAELAGMREGENGVGRSDPDGVA